MIWSLLTLIQIILIYLCTRYAMKRVFHACLTLTHSPRLSLYIFALLYWPGTVIHELAHYFTSIALFVMPHSIHLFPKLIHTDDGYRLHLGSVHSSATDPFRSMLIGYAPLVWGLGILYAFFSLSILPHTAWWVNALSIYGLFVVSSCMFLSKEDMKHGLILIPLGVVYAIFLYVSDYSIVGALQHPSVVRLARNMTLYLAPVSLLHITVYLGVHALYTWKRR